MNWVGRVRAFVAVALVGALTAPVVAIGAPGGTRAGPSDAAGTRPDRDRTAALVQLEGEPLATYPATKPAPGKKVELDSSTVRSYRAELAARRDDLKAWLRVHAPNARVTGEFDIALNAVAVELNGESLATLAGAPNVRRADYQGLYYPEAADPDLSIIEAAPAWAAAGGPAQAGAGVRVAIVDSGIDVSHPCFADAGYAAQRQLGDRRFTNNKVVAARVFYNKAQVAGLTPEAVQAHGTHVAGTVACNFQTPAMVDGVEIPYRPSGVAPRALLGNYNVFPGDVDHARSEDILNALETAYADGFDIANLSIGGGGSGVQDLLALAVDNLDRANMVVAVAAGNSGPGPSTIQSPGSAARALTAGASTVPHFVGAPVTVGAALYGALPGGFAALSADLTAALAVVGDTANGLGTACSALSEDLRGKIALVARGGCSFSTKIRNAQVAGATAVLVANHLAGDPVAMTQDGTPAQPTVPAYMVALSTGQALLSGDGASTTIGASRRYISTPRVEVMAGFSSRGPTNVDGRVKPDVVAPGVNVLSAVPANACAAPPCWAFLQGTSMATAHLAGAAAAVRGQHPGWSATQVRSAIVNTADDGALRDSQTGTRSATDANLVGAGRASLLSAVRAGVALDPVSISFGAVPAGSGPTRTVELTLTNTGGAPATFSAGVGASTGSGVGYALSPTSVELAPGASAVLAVTMTAEKGAGVGDHQARLSVASGGTEVAHAAVYALVR